MTLTRSFFVGIIQTTYANIRASFQDEIPVRENSFFFSNSDTNDVWYDFADSSKNFRPDISIRTSFSLDLKAFLEGFYNPETGLMIKDTIEVQVLSFNHPHNLIDSAKGILDSTGSGMFHFTNVKSDSEYYFVIFTEIILKHGVIMYLKHLTTAINFLTLLTALRKLTVIILHL